MISMTREEITAMNLSQVETILDAIKDHLIEAPDDTKALLLLRQNNLLFANAPGQSAYDLAVTEGFVGSKEEWLESLEGENGTIGVDGKSAYQSAVDAGFVGTEPEWILSLKGEKGDQGDAGTGGSGGGSPFQVIEWDPITFGTSEPLVFIPDANSIVTPTSIYSTEVTPDIINVGGPGFDIEVAIASATISNNTSGTFTIKNIRTDVYTPMMIVFSSMVITGDNIVPLLEGDGEGVAALFQVLNISAYYGSPQDTRFILGSPGGDNGAGVAADITQTTLSFNNGTITTENPDIFITTDLDTYNVMTVIAFGDYLKVINGDTGSNPVIPVEFTNNLAVTATSVSEIPDEAVDGTVLKIIGHNGTLLGQPVEIEDECTLFNSVSEFLLDRSFDVSVDDSLHSGVLQPLIPEIQTVLNPTTKVTMRGGISVVNYTKDNNSSTQQIIIKDSVKDGTIVINNRTANFISTNIRSETPFYYVAENTTDSIDYPLISRSISIPGYHSVVVRVNFNSTVGVVKLESRYISMVSSDIDSSDDITILSDINTDGIITIGEQDNGHVKFRVRLVNRSIGMTLSLASNSPLNDMSLFDSSGNLLSSSGNFQYGLTPDDISLGYVDFSCLPALPISPDPYSLYASFTIDALTSLYGSQSILPFTYMPQLRDTSIFSTTADGLLYIENPLNPLNDLIISTNIEPAITTGSFNVTWVDDTAHPEPIVGDLIKITTQVSNSGGDTSIVWDDLLIQPVIDNTVDGFYTITQEDIDAQSVILTYTINPYAQQFIKFSAGFYHSTTTELVNQLSEFVIFNDAAGRLPSAAIVYITDNIDVDATYGDATHRPYQEMFGGIIENTLCITNTAVENSKAIVTALVSDMPNSGFGESSIAPPVIDGSIDTTIFEFGSPVLFPITFSTPGTNPYFVKFITYFVDADTGDRVSADTWSYVIVQPTIDAVTISGPDYTYYYYNNQYYFSYPPNALDGDTLEVTEDSTYPPTAGIPFSISITASATNVQSIMFTYTGYGRYQTINARLVRENITGILVKGVSSSFQSYLYY